MRIVKKCPTCNKIAETANEMQIGSLIIRTYTCGHTDTLTGTVAADEDTLNIISLDGKRPFKYQLEGGRFIEAANGCALVADEMALGKTVQALMYVKAHPECCPFMVFPKAGLRVQWNKESVRWGDFMMQVLDEGANAFFLPGMDGYIVSLDSAWRIGMKMKKTRAVGEDKATITYEPIPGKTLPDMITKLGIKTIIIDECQMIKNPESKRTKAIQQVCQMVDHKIALSGTPIKNNAAEYFPILNMLRPDKFPSHKNFVFGWCDTYFDGYKTKTGGLKNVPKFMEFTKDFIIRRTRNEVLPDLPNIFRQFSYHELGELVEDMYKQAMREFLDYHADSGSDTGMARSMNLLAMLSKMRHLTGIAKIEPVCEYVEEHIMQTNRKIAIFHHHKDVGASIRLKLENMSREWPAEWGKGILQLSSDMDSYQRDEVIMRWASDEYRVCVLSTLASGEGLNLQFCSDMIQVERQWNPANEEQVEARFPRPGQTADKINAHYPVAVGTVDEMFSEIVERKREICNMTMSGQAIKWDESSIIRELADVLAAKGGKKWGW